MKVGAGSDTGVCDSTQKLLTRAKSEKCERPSSGRKWHGSRGRHRHDCRRKKQLGRWHLKWRKSRRRERQERHRRRRLNADVADKHANPINLKGRWSTQTLVTRANPRNMNGRREEQRRRAHGNQKRHRCHDGSRCVHDVTEARQNPPTPSSLRKRPRRIIGTSHANR